MAQPSDAENLRAEKDDDSKAPAQYEMSDFDDETNDADMGLLDIGRDQQAMNLAEQLGIVAQQNQRPRLNGKRAHRRRQYQVLEVYSPHESPKKSRERILQISAQDWHWISR